MTRKSVLVEITGRVQGVSFRFHALREARRLGLDGWVRNCVDGSVELRAEGPEDALRALLAWCQEGPPSARVDTVGAKWGAATGEDRGFDVRY